MALYKRPELNSLLFLRQLEPSLRKTNKYQTWMTRYISN